MANQRTPKLIPLTTPGEDLAEVLEGEGLSAYALAKAIRKAPIMTPGYWLGLQTDYDLRMAQQEKHVPVTNIV